MTDDPTTLTATAAAALIANGDLSSEALVGACLARIEAREPVVAAWSHVDPCLALEQARACDRIAPTGPLHGVPVGIKDIIDTRDQPTTHGSRAYAGVTPMEDAACVAALREAGAVILGKTVTTEFANRDPGPTSHPLNRLHTPGGSSSGSAAAVADGMVPLALASQTAGSTIRPAAYCGIYGFKPTFGLLSLAGMGALCERFDTLGLYARGVADLALLRDALLGVDAAGIGPLAGGPPRVRLCRTPLWDEAQPESQAAVERAAEAFSAAGVTVEELSLPSEFDTLREAMWEIIRFELARALLPVWRRSAASLRSTTQSMFRAGREISLARHVDNIKHVEACGRAMDSVLPGDEIVLTPSAVGEAPVGVDNTGPPTFNFLWHVLGMPAVQLPCGLGPGGLPIGVQLVAHRHADDHLLATAAWADGVLAG